MQQNIGREQELPAWRPAQAAQDHENCGITSTSTSARSALPGRRSLAQLLQLAALQHGALQSTYLLDDRLIVVPNSSLTICHWSDVSRSDEVITNPAWGEVDAAIRLLDNHERNDIYLRPIRAAKDTYLAVGGGAGRYVVSGSMEGRRFPTLENPSGSEAELVPVCVGGQLGEYPSRYVVDLSVALAAVRSFYDAVASSVACLGATGSRRVCRLTSSCSGR
jgi:hypothetical protein